MTASLLVLGRTQEFREQVARVLRPLATTLASAEPMAPLDDLITAGSPDLIVVDLGSGDDVLVERLRALRQRVPSAAILAIADAAGASTAVAVMNSAIDDYTLAPPVPAELLARCHAVLGNRDLHRRLDLLQVELNRRYGAHRIVCRSQPMEAVYDRVLQLAATRTTVLIQGESGAGKELVARSLHYNGSRRDHPFVAVNCAAFTETLVESELFGHQRGAFTGAVETVPGKFELADGGTLFLDEIGAMGLPAQARLLRVLEEGEFMRVGGAKTLRVDVRVLAATNADLDEAVRRGEFRKDLLYRLKVATIVVPPLRARRDDIPVLARTFVRQTCEENGLPVKDLTPEAVERLRALDWPGNVRELKNLLETLVVTVAGPVIGPEHLPGVSPASRAPGRLESAEPMRLRTLAEVEREHLVATLAALDGNRTRAARALGIGIRTLQRKIREYALESASPVT